MCGEGEHRMEEAQEGLWAHRRKRTPNTTFKEACEQTPRDRG